MGNRPPINRALRRRLMVESGHRCSIPTCRTLTTEIAHIEPFRKVKNYEYDNLIVLCPTCHARADKGEIDRKALRMYKRIVQHVTDRYDRFELNVLDELRQGHPVMIHGGMVLLIKNLLDEHLVELPFKFEWGTVIYTMGEENSVSVSLTEKGKNFIDEWMKANKTLAY